MAVNYAYNYAEIDLTTRMCIGFVSTTAEQDLSNSPQLILVPVNDPEHVGKYYINGNWYEDAAGTIPWQSSLI